MINSLLLSSALNTTLIFSGQALDIASTRVALSHCPSCYEGNGVTSNQAVLTGMKVGFGFFTLAITKELEKTGHKKAARILAITSFVIPAALAYHNLQVSKIKR